MRRTLIVVVALAMTLVAVGAFADAPKSTKLESRESQTAAVGTPIGKRSLRVAGEGRIETAVAISQEMGWDQSNTAVVFLAYAYNYPDALAMGASDADLGPILFTERDTLPEATRKELERLRPCEVIALGGKNAIATSVILAADAYTMDCAPA